MTSRIPALRTCVIALLVLLTAPAAVLGAPQLYDVEIIIFSHNNESGQGEAWQRPDAGAGRAQGYLAENRFTELSSSRYQLNSVRYSLKRGGEYTVLYHRAWRQLAYSPSQAVDYPVHSFSSDSRQSIEGSVRLVRERYLHLSLDLVLKDATAQLPGHYSDAPGNTPVYRLSEKRRIKISDLHYFDHPHIGVLALVTPYSAPEKTVDENAAEQADAVAPATVESAPSPADAAGGQTSP
ncbi:MAG: CsiV family protein [Gammaproteobacteria bacterium]